MPIFPQRLYAVSYSSGTVVDLDAVSAGERKIVMGGILWGIIVVLFILWLLGFALHFGGGLIHIVLVIAVVLIVVNLLTGRGARV
jgi:Family of unknown function (DUF5670)